MNMADPKLDAMLLEYLLGEKARKDAGATPEAILASMRNLADNFSEHEKVDERRFAEIEGELKGLGYRVVVVERGLEKLADRTETTGRHELERIEKARERLESVVDGREKEERARSSWIERHWVSVVTGLVTAIVSATAAGILVANLTGKG